MYVHTDAMGNTTYKRIDRIYHSPHLHNKVFINNYTCRTTGMHPIDITSTHNPIDITILLEENDDKIPFYHDIWRMNTYVAAQIEVKTELNKIKREMWAKCKNKNPKAIEKQYLAMRKKCTAVLKGAQDNEKKTITKEKEKLKNDAGYVIANDTGKINRAAHRLKEIEQHEDRGAFIRSRCQDVEFGTKNSKYHHGKAKKNHKQQLIKMVLKPDGTCTETSDHKGISDTITDVWEDIVGLRPIDQHDLSTTINSITIKLDNQAKQALGSDLPDPLLHTIPAPELLLVITVPDIYNSITFHHLLLSAMRFVAIAA